jgi:cell wall-active antibiotic response 4TMS protein YvqF
VRYTYRYRSFFWPALIILVGLLALLVNTGQISIDRLGELVNLWPLILIVVGLELILRRTVHGVAGDVAAALVVILAIVAAAVYVTAAPNPAQAHSIDSSADLGNIDQASLEVAVGSATIDVSADTSVGSDLYRAHIDYSGPEPKVDLDRSSGALRISQSTSNTLFFQSRRFNLKIDLNPSIPWAIHEDSGAVTDHLDLGSAHVTQIRINTGASRDDITLGQPSASVPVTVNGGALTVNVHRPAGVITTVEVSGGAVSLTVDGQAQHAIGRITVAPANPNGDPAYDIRVNGGACTVTVDSSGSSPTPQS